MIISSECRPPQGSVGLLGSGPCGMWARPKASETENWRLYFLLFLGILDGCMKIDTCHTELCSAVCPCTLFLSSPWAWAHKGVSWAAPVQGLHGAVLFPFLLTHLLTSSPLARASWGFLITGSGVLPALGSGHMREEVWLPPISRNTRVVTGPNHSVLFPWHPPCCFQHCCFTYYLSNPRDYSQNLPCRNRRLGGQGCRWWKVEGRGGDAESRKMYKFTFLLQLPWFRLPKILKSSVKQVSKCSTITRRFPKSLSLCECRIPDSVGLVL